MRCLSCKTGDMVESTNTYFTQINGCYILIKNVPCFKCTQCGEVFYKSSTLEKIDSIVERIQNQLTEICVMDYSRAA